MNISDKSQLEQPDQRMSQVDQNMFEQTLCSRRWTVGVFNDGQLDSRTDETARFADYVFEFNDKHVVIAKGTDKNIVGKWNTFTADGVKRLVLDFGYRPCIKLNAKWALVDYTSEAITLRNSVGNETAALDFKAVYDVAK